jgi:pullulanase/glycogen debranching enzyme
MRNFFKIVLFIFITNQFSAAQVVTSDPLTATENDSIVVYFDATKGDAGLKGFTGTVYAHTGVITDKSANLKDWKYVKTNWPINITANTLTRISTDYYKLVIGNPREYYSANQTGAGPIPSNERIKKLAFVFRNFDGSKTGRDVGGEDIYLDLYEPGLTLNVVNPEVSVKFGDPQRSPAFVKFGETVPINVEAVELGTKVSTLTLYVDGNQVEQTNANSLSYNFVHSNFSTGAHTIKVLGIDTTGSKDSTSFMMFSNPANKNFALPNGLKQGINYTSPTTAVLALFAPQKDFVYLIGDFNDWKVETDFMMNREFVNPDSVIWWLELNSLSPGTEYAFQYLVNGNLRIGDPYSEKVLDSWNDPYIPSTTYPNLMSYPSGKTEDLVSVLQTAKTEYQWQVTDFQKPTKEKLVIYELLVRDFSSQHNYQFLIDTLSYLKSLGVNAIELMPVNEFEGNISWGYNPSYHLALDKYYGTPDKLKEFIDLCHQNGIAVILDIVLNHSFGQNPLVKLYFDGYYTIGSNSGIKTTPNNPYFNVTSPNTTYFWGADFNHEKSATKYYVDRVNRFWLEEFKFDGFRFDFTKGFTNTPGDGGNYDQSRINILKRMTDQIWAFDSTAYVILEHFAANNEENVLSNYGMMIWGNINYNYNEATMGYHDSNKSNFSGVSYKTRGWSKPHLVGYMESHDEERLMYKNLQYGNSFESYNIKFIGEALNRMKLAAAFFFTVPGPKMVWQFGELGYDISIDYNGRTGEKPIKWDYNSDPRRKNVYKVFNSLIELKKNYEAFSTNNFSMDVATAVKKMNLYHPSMDAFIIGNFGVDTLNPGQNFSRTGWWYDYFSGDSIEVINLTAPISLAPGEFKIYTTSKLPTPEADILLEVGTEQPLTVTEFKLEQNYPNPFNPATKISWQSPVGSRQSLKIYDLLGKEVATLVDEFKPAGTYEVNFDASNLPSGVYIYRLQAGSYFETKKMVLLK